MGSLVLGLFIAMARMSKRRWLQVPAAGYIEVFRNTPVPIQLIRVYYGLPILTGLEISAAPSATLALCVNGAAYVAEIICGGIQSIDRGQVEAARTIGLSFAQTMRKVVMPQAFRRMMPPFVNEAVSILKFSSLVSVLGVADLTYQAQVLSTTTFRPIEVLTFIGVVYFALCTGLSSLASRLELHLARSD